MLFLVRRRVIFQKMVKPSIFSEFMCLTFIFCFLRVFGRFGEYAQACYVISRFIFHNEPENVFRFQYRFGYPMRGFGIFGFPGVDKLTGPGAKLFHRR